MTTALADTPVPVRAFLGSATVNLEDLRGLSAGDTLVLSTPVAHGVAVAAGRADAVFASAELLQEDQRLVLRLNP
jgi:flagellar motor switch/type III secretory pathway protein FliN